MVKGLCESMRGQWSGDVDLDDGRLKLLYKEYQQRLAEAKAIGLGERKDHIDVDLNSLLQELVEDLEFIHSSELISLLTHYFILVSKVDGGGHCLKFLSPLDVMYSMTRSAQDVILELLPHPTNAVFCPHTRAVHICTCSICTEKKCALLRSKGHASLANNCNTLSL